MGAALCGGVAVPGFAELASRIPAVALQALIEPFFLHQPVNHVPGKAALRAVLVEQAAQASGCVSLMALATTDHLQGLITSDELLDAANWSVTRADYFNTD